MPRKKTEIENPPATKGRSPSVSKVAEKPLCHIHDKVDFWEVGYFRENVPFDNEFLTKFKRRNYEIFHLFSKDKDIEEIRQNVCVNDEPLTKHTDGNHYCLFHLPTKGKNIAKFKQILQARVETIEQKFGEIEKLSEDKQAKAKSELSYDFRNVWFPSEVSFYDHTFIAVADFRSATFSADANFSSATFTSDANFSSATFASDASFVSANFTSKANFLSSRFLGIAYFSWVIFKADAFFKLATFTLDGYFTLATFESDADFTSTNFEEESQIFFKESNINGVANFNHAIFDGYIGFEGKKENPVFVGENALLILDNARIKNAKEISFHSVRLMFFEN